MIVLEKTITSFPEDDKRRKFLEELDRLLETIEPDDRLFATHGHCTDGAVAAAMVRNAVPYAKIIPIDYWYLNNEDAGHILKQLPFEGIIDLAPFNLRQVKFWVDHHVSSIGHPLNAKQVRFDADGDSGSYQLLLSGFLGEFPQYVVELATLTRITDTASYTMIPPDNELENLEGILQVPFYFFDDLKKVNETIQQRAYLLDDAVASCYALKDWNKLVNSLASKGLEGIIRFLPQINELRKERKKAYEIAQELKTSDCVVVILSDEQYDVFSIRRYLQNRGPKVVISLTQGHDGFRISLRRSKGLSPQLNSKIQLHELAKKLGGGGHAAASGAFSKTLEKAMEEIKNWCGSLDLKLVVHDLREE